MLHSKSDNTVKKVLFILSKVEIFLYSTQLYRYSDRAYTHCALFNPNVVCWVFSWCYFYLGIGLKMGSEHELGGRSDENRFMKNLHESAKRLRSTKTVKKYEVCRNFRYVNRAL